jgi:Mrp family chromosome partitioning ATPase
MSRIFELLRQAQLDGALLQRPIAPTATHSRNFELLHQTQKDRLRFESAASPAAVPTELAPPRPAEYSGGETFKLVQRLFLADGALAPRAVVFCAVEQRSEDSRTCARVAEMLARHIQGSSVCVMDANLASPSLHAYFDVENRGGLAGVILETGPVMDFTQSLGRGYLRLMSAGVLTPGTDANEVLGSKRLRTRMSELRASFDYILVNAPTAATGSVMAHLAALVDGVILIVEPSFTPRQAAQEAKDNIEAAGGRVLGVVLHRRGLPFRHRTEQPQRSLKPARNS